MSSITPIEFIDTDCEMKVRILCLGEGREREVNVYYVKVICIKIVCRQDYSIICVIFVVILYFYHNVFPLVLKVTK